MPPSSNNSCNLKGWVISMDNTFPKSEKLYRAIYPPEKASMFWRKDGSVSSAAFADSKGLYAERGNFQSDDEVTAAMLTRFTGYIVSLYAKDCYNVGAILQYLPSKSNIYHSEIHGSQTTPLLSKSQRYHLTRKARILIRS